MTLDTTTRQRIIDAVNAGFEAQLAFTADMVRFDSTRGNEAAMQDFMARSLRERGYEVDHWKIEVDDIKDLPGFSPVEFVSYEQAYNVVGTRHPKENKGRSLIINGHIDVVPPCDADRWTTPPFEPRIANGRMYGRGAGDMKSGLAAGIFAIEALKAAGLAPAAPVYIQSVVEEECTGNGTLACVQRGYKADGALVPEPFGAEIMRAQIGLMWLCIDIEGDPQHASAAFQHVGANALEKAIHIWPYIKRLEAEWNARKENHRVYKDHPHPIRVNLGKFSGGDWVSSVPAKARMEVRLSILEGEDLATIRGEILARVAEAVAADPYLVSHPPKVTFHGFQAEGYVLEPGSDIEAVMGQAHEAVFGEPVQTSISSALTDARFFGLYQNTPSIVYGPTCGLPHGIDEYVDLESLKQVTRAYALFIADWCGVEPV
ncbi:ArgE/DapE family deacylase [Falsochrobactrum sp. TDYN1]|uniref:ArgE/DapE family deacylase n=1 Tax=Falsochrobactrum tianjinense TaxID=2706015 RepID=A0A949PQG8_9HYPH|nr:ArgE/DapE family deacylase [Falsochrobactrum sp. TDYN1]MBV2144962.1 ArgE/DapE family deacylase [Falsochrobactrum sp. TDYN1]